MPVAAPAPTAAPCTTDKGGRHLPRGRRVRRTHAPRRAVTALALCTALLPALIAAPTFAASNKVRITNLSDVSFGTIANLSLDAVVSQSVCLYADTNTNGYNVTASGTGAAGAFALSSGTASLPYDVEWSNSAGKTSGTQLTANVPLTGQVSAATHQSCSNGPASSASLILVLRSAALSSASAGTYSGTLTLLVGPE
jgi:hypothetical protein